MTNSINFWISRLSYYGGLPADNDEQRLRRAVLIFLASICTILGFIWGISYLAWGLRLAGSIPIGYSIASGISLFYFFQTKRYRFLCRSQLALILVFPFLLQYSLGGFTSSGAVIIWSILSPIGALMFAGVNRSIPWFVAYILLMLLSGITGGHTWVQTRLPPLVIVVYFVMNIGGVCTIVFFLLRYFVKSREQALAALDREHRRVRHSLSLAKEVQQNLLPKTDPHAAGLDICGQSIYCDETGGDYYDFLESDHPGDGKIGLVVGDVSDHGIPSALLMATVRALIRQRCTAFDSIVDVVADVNLHLAQDVKDSGRFMTLFYAEIDRPHDIIRWVNAGHDPAIVYDPHTDTFDPLNGGGNLALGVMQNARYWEAHRAIAPGQIIVLSTDGIWEARNPSGEMFGKERLCAIIRQHSAASAKDIQKAVFESIRHFQKNVKLEDDMTLVIVKVA